MRTRWNFESIFLKIVHQKGLFDAIKENPNFPHCRRILDIYWQWLLIYHYFELYILLRNGVINRRFIFTGQLKTWVGKCYPRGVICVSMLSTASRLVPERRNINSIPGVNVPYFRDKFIPGINSVPERRNNAIKGINLG